MKRMRSFARAPFVGLALLGVLVAAAACGTGAGDADTTGAVAPNATVTPPAATPAPYAFPTGPAVTVPVGYTLPRDRVDSTGAHLPVNGKPTLVFVDAIW